MAKDCMNYMNRIYDAPRPHHLFQLDSPHHTLPPILETQPQICVYNLDQNLCGR